jgi:nucleotide-binding universal stress UspA family protein
VVVVIVIGLSIPYLSFDQIQPSSQSFGKNWSAFVGVILALSGVEAIASLTGVMKLDPGATMEAPKVKRTSAKAIWVVALEVVFGTSLLGWAMVSLPRTPGLELQMKTGWEDMMRFLGEQYATQALGPDVGKVFGVAIGLIVGLLLLSAVNTAITAMIGAFYLMAKDGEMPRSFTKLNSFGVPWLPIAVATILPIIVLVFTTNLMFLADLYAIGVVGAITVNLGSCCTNSRLPLKVYERIIMGITFLILLAVEVSISYTKHDALFFACCVLAGGMALRGWAQARAGFRTITVRKEVAAHASPETTPDLKFTLNSGQAIMVAARGVTPVLHFAADEARLRGSVLYVLYVQEVVVNLPAKLTSQEKARWQDNSQAAKIMYAMLKHGGEIGIQVVPVYVVSDSAPMTILDLSATLGVDYLILGAPHRTGLVKLLKGDVVTEVAKHLPENIHLVIFG